MVDHPRRCGENGIDSSKNVSMLGSPPQVRGKRSGNDLTISIMRITPAGAGKTAETKPPKDGE